MDKALPTVRTAREVSPVKKGSLEQNRLRKGTLNSSEENGEDDGINKRSPEEEAHESFPWIPESEEDEDDGVSKRHTEEEHEIFPWIQ